MSFESRDFRDALGRFATGVCVVATGSGDRGPMGMTINSFAAVSLQPPLVLWSLQYSSDCFDTLSTATHYTINVLAREQLGLSQRYARTGEHDLLPEHYRLGTNGAPILRGVLASFECEAWQRLDAGDHQVILGRVTAMEKGGQGEPLLFYNGAYRELR
jgi:flavin reductase (DIM6/NTAB) family NADH-FMN oxidoreductase RutF